MSKPKRSEAFRHLLIRAAVLPIGLLLLLAGLLVWQIQLLLSSAVWVERTDEILGSANRLERLHIDMETGLRGYLITHNPAFLEPFNRGVEIVSPLSESITRMLSDEPGQQKLLAEIEKERTAWIAYARREITERDTGADWVATVAAGTGKAMMDRIRVLFDQFITAEEKLRADRDRAARRTASRSVWIASLAALGIGTILALLSRREMSRLADTYEEALATSRALTTELENRVAERTTQLAHANDALTDANRELEAFAYSISHDLRAPMRHIGGFAELLRKSVGQKLSADEAENLDTIQDTAKLAGRMVDDLLAFSRISRTELRRDRVDMNELVERCRRELIPEMHDRQIAWKIGDLPPAEGDPALLKLVLSNLLSNAVKYTSKRPDGTISVAATANNDNSTTYSVADNGIGFDMAYVHKLFGVFQRLHRAEEYEGTGIGLANVRRIITRHGGRVWAEGRSGEGATFYFSLPNRTST
jgi:signal transduction histidine kinase